MQKYKKTKENVKRGATIIKSDKFKQIKQEFENLREQIKKEDRQLKRER